MIIVDIKKAHYETNSYDSSDGYFKWSSERRIELIRRLGSVFAEFPERPNIIIR